MLYKYIFFKNVCLYFKNIIYIHHVYLFWELCDFSSQTPGFRVHKVIFSDDEQGVSNHRNETHNTVDGWNPANQVEVGSLSHYL